MNERLWRAVGYYGDEIMLWWGNNGGVRGRMWDKATEEGG